MTEPTDLQPALPQHGDHFRETPLRKFFEAAIKHGSSDLIIKPQTPIRLRLRGSLRTIEAEPYTAEEFEQIIEQFLTADQREHYLHHGAIDLAYDFDEDNRFRVNVFRARGRSELAARRVSTEILTFEQLHLPPILGEIADAHLGLVLVCGITGSGKSTTLASMLQRINLNRPCHIVTIEDPIEFIFRDAKALVSQREVGVDVPTFSDGLRSLVRENPDVVLIGEMRDRETFEAAIQAAETGHLVFGTIHASSASQAFGRIYNLFPPDERDLIRDMFAQNLRSIIYQKLLPTLMKEPARVPATEVLINGPVVRKYILEGREVELPDVIRQSQKEGMIDFNSSLVQLVEKEYIHPKTALANAFNANELKMRLKGIQTDAS
jgi:twitching motility protein PilT